MTKHENEIPMTIRGDSDGGRACKLVQLANFADTDGIQINFGLNIYEDVNSNFFYNGPSQISSCKVMINCLETEEDGKTTRILAVAESPDIELNGVNRYLSFELYKATTRLFSIEKLSLLEFYIVFKYKRISIIDRF